MANERAGWKMTVREPRGRGVRTDWRLSNGTQWIEITRFADGSGGHVEVGCGDSRCYMNVSDGQLVNMCALPLVPPEATPAIADGTSQPWTPPADQSAEVKRRVSKILSFARESAVYSGDNRPRRWEMGAIVRMAAKAMRALGFPQPDDEAFADADDPSTEAQKLTEERDDALARVGQLEAEVVSMTRERDQCLESCAAYSSRLSELRMRLDARGTHAPASPDREAQRFELVKAVMSTGRDGPTAVRDADEALEAMGATGGVCGPPCGHTSLSADRCELFAGHAGSHQRMMPSGKPLTWFNSASGDEP